MTLVFPNQPPVPTEEGIPSELEQLFVAESPPGLYPENRNSNIGILRQTIIAPLDEAVTTVDEIWLEGFVESASDWLYRWEDQVGLPTGTGLSEAVRRSNILSRLRKTPFTRTRRRELIEGYIVATFGTPIIFTPAGVKLVAAGVPFYSEAGDVSTLYGIIEFVENFSYEVWISSTVDPDLVSLERELKRINPAGISYSVVRGDVTELEFAILSTPGLLSYWLLDEASGTVVNNRIPTGVDGTYTGIGHVTPSIIPAYPTSYSADFPGTGTVGVTLGDDYDFAGTVPFSVEAWVVGDVLNDLAARYVIGKLVTTTTGGWRLYNDNTSGGRFVFARVAAGGTAQTARMIGPPFTTGTLYHLVGTYDGTTAQIYVNGVAGTSSTTAVTLPDTTDILSIGAISAMTSARWDGRISHVALYDRALSAAEVLQHYTIGAA